MHPIIRPDDDVDAVARHLMALGALARRMPPAWDGARIAHPILTPGLAYAGRVLPGRGVYLDRDLKHVGIRRRLPFVYERSPIQRLLDWLQDERGAITTYDGIIAARAGGKADDVAISKTSITTVANAWSTLFRAGGFPVAGTYTNIPGGAAHNRASTGAWSVGLANPTSPDKKYLLTFGFTSTAQINMLILADLLVAAGNINANTTLAQTINSVALTRYTTGAGVLMTFDVTTALGATASSLTVTSYTNQSGTTGRSTPAVAMTTSAAVMRLQPAALGPFMQLADGDYGVRSVEELQFSAAMGAGVLALNLYFPLAFIPGVGANLYMERDSTTQIDGLSELVTEAGGSIGCLTAYILPNSTSSGVLTAFMRTCAG